LEKGIAKGGHDSGGGPNKNHEKKGNPSENPHTKQIKRDRGFLWRKKEKKTQEEEAIQK